MKQEVFSFIRNLGYDCSYSGSTKTLHIEDAHSKKPLPTYVREMFEIFIEHLVNKYHQVTFFKNLIYY